MSAADSGTGAGSTGGWRPSTCTTNEPSSTVDVSIRRSNPITISLVPARRVSPSLGYANATEGGPAAISLT
ncbi:MAG: hypothetical protein AAFP86_24460, partial [Planctomycetota bacterium]